MPWKVPPGTMFYFAGATAPGGYLLADGRAVSRATYPALFTAIGTIWGVGDGSTTFNLPDMRGRVPLGSGAGVGLTTRALAAVGGEEGHVLTGGEVAAHGHPINDTLHYHPQHDPQHNHVAYPATTTAVQFSAGTGQDYLSPLGSNLAALGGPNAMTGITIDASGTGLSGTQSNAGGAGHSSLQPFAVLFGLVKT